MTETETANETAAATAAAAAAAAATNDTRVLESIYIGGLDPPRLTAKEVTDRFYSLVDVTIQSVEEHGNKSFCHVKAISKDSNKSALQIVSSTYNNVKWKGCRLAVQAAKPHFLERLEDERRELQREKEAQKEAIEAVKTQTESTTEAVDPTEETKSSFIPRRLRIRKKFGDEAHHVDTKPWSVDNWSHFSSAITKLQKRVEKHANTARAEPSIMPPPLMHRAVHIRFEDPDHKSASSRKRESTDEKPAMAALKTDSDDSSSDDSESSENDDQETAPAKSLKQAAYDWSDDSSDEGDSYNDPNVQQMEEDDDASLIFEKSQPDLVPDAPLAKKGTVDLSANHEESNTAASGSPTPNETQRRPSQTLKEGVPKESYQWSSEEESSDDDDDDDSAMERNRSLPLRPVTQSDEFAAGLDDDDDDDDDDNELNRILEEEDEDEDGTAINPREEEKGNLTHDVSGNLDILSSLFPEVSDAKPALAVQNLDNDKTEGDKKERKSATQNGFSSSGIMLRFDPNDASTQQLELSEEEEAKDEGNDESDADDDDDESDKEPTKSDNKGKRTDKDMDEMSSKEPIHIYEQGKLEDVFREARSAWQGAPASNTDKTRDNRDGDDSTGGAFSFGFDLGSNAVKDPDEHENQEGFNFGFALPGQETSATSTENKANTGSRKGEVTETDPQESQTKPSERRLRGINLPEDMARMYEAAFFRANDGLQIMNDPEGFRNDPDVKEVWKGERHGLTLDWKRKRKLAQSRIQKRMKIR